MFPLAGLAALALVAVGPAPALGQILDRILDKAEEVKEVADKVGSAVVPISTAQEIEIGRGIAATIAGHYGLVEESPLDAYVRLVGTTVASVDPRPDIRYRFAILDTDEFAGRYSAFSLTDRDYVEFLYKLLLERDPDAHGLDSYATELASGGVTRAGGALGLVNSSEFRSTHAPCFESEG